MAHTEAPLSALGSLVGMVLGQRHHDAKAREVNPGPHHVGHLVRMKQADAAAEVAENLSSLTSNDRPLAAAKCAGPPRQKKLRSNFQRRRARRVERVDSRNRRRP